MEAISCGKPIIASNIRGCNDFSKAGVVVNPKNYKSIESGINKIFNTKFNEKIIKKIIKKYDVNKVLWEVAEIYENYVD